MKPGGVVTLALGGGFLDFFDDAMDQSCCCLGLGWELPTDDAVSAYALFGLGGDLEAGWQETLESAREDMDANPLIDACSTAESWSVTVFSLVDRLETKEISCCSSVGWFGWLIMLEMRLVWTCRRVDEPDAKAIVIQRKHFDLDWECLNWSFGG